MFFLTKIWRERLWRYAPLVLWLAIVLFNSTGNASMANTSRIIRPILLWLFPHISEVTLTLVHAYIRKTAHFTEYFLLGFFASRALRSSLREILNKNWFAISFGIVAFVAFADEFNQSFNSARTSSIYDVLLDCSGGLTALILVYWWKRRFSHEQTRNKGKNML